MREKRNEPNGKTFREEFEARLSLVRAAMDKAGIPREFLKVPDMTGHEVTIPASLVIALCKFVEHDVPDDEAAALLKEAIAIELAARGIPNVAA